MRQGLVSKGQLVRARMSQGQRERLRPNYTGPEFQFELFVATNLNLNVNVNYALFVIRV